MASSGMLKTSNPRSKAAKPADKAPKRKSAAQRFRELPLAERRKRLEVFFDDVQGQWEGGPKSGAVDYLIQLRRET
jgi:hypothetical protein